MKKLLTSFCLALNLFGKAFAANLDYTNCQSLEDVIILETLQIKDSHPLDHENLANLYTCRGESYLLNDQYKNAIEDFKIANSHLGYSTNSDRDMILAFRGVFGASIGYDKLGMQEDCIQSLEQLQIIINQVGCDHCLENNPCQENSIKAANKKTFSYKIIKCNNISKNFYSSQNLILKCKHKKKSKQTEQEDTAITQDGTNTDTYDDILGPDQPPDSDWCKEIVVGVGAAMEVIAMKAPTPWVKGILMSAIAALTTRATKCCDAGNFWKACVAPITRKWRDWNNKAKVFTYPNQDNLELYTN